MAPQVVAHRGASRDWPEHTEVAYRRALDAGADALECDIRLTADGHLVCLHDRSLLRTSDGTGTVSTMTLAQLQLLDFGSWKTRADGSDATGAAAEPQRVLTLRRLFELVAECDRRVEIAVETKHPTRAGDRVELALAGLLREYGWDGSSGAPGPVRVMSFSTTALRRMVTFTPGLPRVWLTERLWWPFHSGALPGGADIAGIDIALLRRDPDYVARARAHGHGVHVWTVNEPEDVALCLSTGVDAIITDRPDLVRGLVTGGTLV